MSRLLEELRKCKARDDRGMMANLRCILVENKKHRAWPALNRLGVPIDNHVSAFIAGLFATHPEDRVTGNFGATCKALKQKRNEMKGDDNKMTLSPTEQRFQHLLVAERGEELYARIQRMVLMAKSEGVEVNYEQLKTDLKFWSNRTKIEWAKAFWEQEQVILPEPEEVI
jgi:CRISPR system Cascade subunit CasB